MSLPLRLYQLLEVDVASDEVTIRRAFKRLCNLVRPDDPKSQEQLKALRGAYDVLADHELRALYDEFGAASLKKGFNPDAARRQLEKERADAIRRAKAALLAPTAVERQQTGPDGTPIRREWTLRIGIGPRLAKSGGLLRLPVTRPITCPRCEGSGRSERSCAACKGGKQVAVIRSEPCAGCRGVGVLGEQRPCKRCRGAGVKRGRFCKGCGGAGIFVQRIFCSICNGRGLKLTRVEQDCTPCRGSGLAACSRCGGEGTISKSFRFRIYVPKRVAAEHDYRYAGAGFSMREGAPTDLHVQFTILDKAPRR